MSTCVSKSSFQLLSSSIKVEEEAPKVIAIEKQGIVSILGSDCEKTKAAASLRRTLSADMSSKKWLAQNGFSSFSPMKKIASSEELAISSADHRSSSSSEGEEEYNEGNKDNLEELKRPGQDDVWRSIQSQKEKKEQPDLWSWGSILVQKNEDSSKLPPPYIHPLVRRSGSSLSEKSLEICTESLGSETGSDGFSLYPPSEVGDVDDEKGNDQQQQSQQPLTQPYEDMRIVKYNNSPSRKMGPRSFPPPLPSMAREDRASIHMHSYRGNGRLVLEAVSVLPQNYFQAQREDGRLRLTFINSPSQEEEEEEEEIEDEVEEFEQVFDYFEEIEGNDAKFDGQGDKGYEEDDEEEEEDDDEDIEEEVEEDVTDFEKEKGRREVEFVMEQSSKLQGGLMDVHKPTLMMKMLMGLDKKNLIWAPRFNKAVNLKGVEEVEDELTPPLPKSLPIPPPPRAARLISAPPETAAAASFNAYEYFWKEKPTMASIIKPMSSEQCQPLKNNQNKFILASNLNLKGYEQQNLVVMRGNKGEYLVPYLKRCKESRAISLLLWEPYCIATS